MQTPDGESQLQLKLSSPQLPNANFAQRHWKHKHSRHTHKHTHTCTHIHIHTEHCSNQILVHTMHKLIHQHTSCYLLLFLTVISKQLQHSSSQQLTLGAALEACEIFKKKLQKALCSKKKDLPLEINNSVRQSSSTVKCWKQLLCQVSSLRLEQLQRTQNDPP